MKLRDLMLGLAFVLLATFNLPAQKPTAHEKLYISLESTDTVAVVDLAAFKSDQDADGRLTSARPGRAAVTGQAVCRL